MKVTPISLIPPQGAEAFPRLTPELCAAVLARYSRSNDGLAKILSKIDLANPDASVDQIFKFVDYGHASIGGLTGSISIAIDDVSMWAAFKLFSLAPYGDGQESSTRYIEMSPSGLGDPTALGFDTFQARQLASFGLTALDVYLASYRALDEIATNNPDVIRYPNKATEAARQRIRKNYALDRSRYFLPMFLRTNVAINQTARAWVNTIAELLSYPSQETHQLAFKLREVLSVYAPRLIKHARPKKGAYAYALQEIDEAVQKLEATHWETEVVSTAWIPPGTRISDSLELRENRYDVCGVRARRTPVVVKWDGIAIAEARDVNRHRTGHRDYVTTHKGFYLPAEARQAVPLPLLDKFQSEHAAILEMGAAAQYAGVPGSLLPYCLVLGSQGEFHRTTTLDKFAYEAELRTGPGAHFRYAEHYRAAVAHLETQLQAEDRGKIPMGEAEPE